MSLARFLDTISSFVPGASLRGREDAIARLDPDKIYLENVRSVLDVPYQLALDICEAAVRQGTFRRGIEVRCPDGVVAISADSEAELPETVHCWQSDHGQIEDVELPVRELTKIIFYRLK